MTVKIIKKKISLTELKKLADESFGDMVKGVVDIKEKILAIGGELHADAETLLIKEGSKQENIWGINVYPDKPKKQRIEYSALINIRPSIGNRSMEILDSQIKRKIEGMVNKFIQ